GWGVGVLMIGVDEGAFWSQMQNGVDFVDDILNGVIKSAVFGVAVTLIALYQGYSARPSARTESRHSWPALGCTCWWETARAVPRSTAWRPSVTRHVSFFLKPSTWSASRQRFGST